MQSLPLFEHLYERACRWHEAGQFRVAQALMQRLISFPDLPVTLVELLHARLGEMYLKRHRYRRARRHLMAALGYRPTAARYHFLLGLAHHHDPAGDREQAAHHYARALERCPLHVRLLLEAGQLALLRGLTDDGLELLRRAADQAPDEVMVIRRLAQGLCQCGQPEEAIRLVRLARFRSPRCPRLQQIWADLQLQMLRREQQTNQPDQEGPVLLPFLRPVLTERAGGGRDIREDETEALPVPYLVRFRRSNHRRHAP